MKVADGHDPFHTGPDAGDLGRGQKAADADKESPEGNENPQRFSRHFAGPFFAGSRDLREGICIFTPYPSFSYYIRILSLFKRRILSPQADKVKNVRLKST
jgi:hypothetical protein